MAVAVDMGTVVVAAAAGGAADGKVAASEGYDGGKEVGGRHSQNWEAHARNWKGRRTRKKGRRRGEAGAALRRLHHSCLAADGGRADGGGSSRHWKAAAGEAAAAAAGPGWAPAADKEAEAAAAAGGTACKRPYPDVGGSGPTRDPLPRGLSNHRKPESGRPRDSTCSRAPLNPSPSLSSQAAAELGSEPPEALILRPRIL